MMNTQLPSMPLWTSDGFVPLNMNKPTEDAKTTPFERRFSPYDFNGGYELFYLTIVKRIDFNMFVLT